MTHEEAVAEAARLTREHPDRATHSWLARRAEGGEWTVVKVGVPRPSPVGSRQEAKPRPPQADDPRPPMWRDTGGPWTGGGL
jgi:hypothetical protein